MAEIRTYGGKGGATQCAVLALSRKTGAFVPSALQAAEGANKVASLDQVITLPFARLSLGFGRV